MQFAQTAGAAGLDLYTDFRKLCGLSTSDTTTHPISPNFTLDANNALDQVTSFIILNDRRWNWDDSNNTDLPQATTSLVSGQADYALATTHLKILDVKIKDSAGNWKNLNKAEDDRLAELQVQNSTSGNPHSYIVRGNSILLSPAPNYASSGGLKIYYQRGAHLFEVTDTTTTPGFASPFHRLVSLYAALDYCAVNDMPKRVAHIEKLIQKLETKFAEFLNARAAENPVRITVESEDYGVDPM